jgi:hypothetical protein
MKDKGIIYEAIKWCLKKSKSITDIQQYIYLKHKIIVGKNAILKRIKYNHKT